MFARVIMTQYQPGTMDEALQIYRESVLPEARQQRGFKGTLGLIDRTTHKAISITLWESEADAQAGGMGSPYLQAQLAKIGSFFAAAPIIEYYEVYTQE